MRLRKPQMEPIKVTAESERERNGDKIHIFLASRPALPCSLLANLPFNSLCSTNCCCCRLLAFERSSGSTFKQLVLLCPLRLKALECCFFSCVMVATYLFGSSGRPLRLSLLLVSRCTTIVVAVVAVVRARRTHKSMSTFGDLERYNRAHKRAAKWISVSRPNCWTQ